MSLVHYRVFSDKQEIHLTPNEYNLLVILAGHPGQTLSREQLLDDLHGNTIPGIDRSIDSHIKNLRQKLEGDKEKARLIETIYGVGYRFIEQG
jgi:DNA-binding response OmpR family regulator